MNRTRSQTFRCAVLALLAVGCSASSPARSSEGQSIGWSGSGGNGAAASGDGAWSGGAGVSAGSASTGVFTADPGDPAHCVGSKATAPPASHPKVDIVWVVDASGSMLDEQERITQNLANFAQSIAAANIDYHIVMITQAVGVPFICPSTGVDDPAPASLASDPNYRFVKHNVDSYNLLDVLVDHYDLYSSFLRADATLHFVTVSDDESTYHDLAPAAIRAAAFTKDMTALLGKPFFVDAIVSEGMENDTPCKPNPCVAPPTAGVCALDCGAANPGATYNALASDTHGVSASICAADWTQVFQSLSQAIVASAPLPCSYPIPPAPGGQTLDPAKVNVGYTQAGASAEEVLPHSNDAKACGDDIAWYYDQPGAPTQVLLCPKACAHVAGGGTLAVTFGCKTFALD